MAVTALAGVAAALLALGVAALALSVLGVLRAPSAAAALHPLSAGSVWGPALLALGLALAPGGEVSAAAKTVLAALLLVLQSPGTAHALARLAARYAETGGEEDG